MRSRIKPYGDHTSNAHDNQHPDPRQYEPQLHETIVIYERPTPPPPKYHDHRPGQSYSDNSQQFSGNVNRYHQEYPGELSSHHTKPTNNLQTADSVVQEGYNSNQPNYNGPADGRTHRRRRVINVKYYKKDPYEGKVPKGEGWVIEPIDGGFRAIKDERALNGWMHIYERAKVIHPSGNSGKTYWYFESIFDPPERVRHIRKKYSKDGVQTEDLTPSNSGYFSHIKFDFDHARRAWRDVLPVIPTEDETLGEVIEREQAEKARRMRAYGSYYKEPTPVNQEHPNAGNNEDSYTANQGPHRANVPLYYQNGPNNRGNTYNEEKTYQQSNQATGDNQYSFNKAHDNYLDVAHLVNELQNAKEDSNSYNVYSAQSGKPWDRGHGSMPRYNYWPQQKGSYNDNEGSRKGKEFNFPQQMRKNNYSFKKESLMSDRENQNLQGKSRDLWVLRVYGFGYTDDNVPLNDLLQFDIEQNVGDTSEKYKSYIDSYDKNAVNIALEEDSMNRNELERAIEELIEFIFARTQTHTHPIPAATETGRDGKTGTFNDGSYSQRPKSRIPVTFRPKPLSIIYYEENTRKTRKFKHSVHNSRNTKPSVVYLDKVSNIYIKPFEARLKSRNEFHNKHLDEVTNSSKYYSSPSEDIPRLERSKSPQVKFYSSEKPNDKPNEKPNEKPYDIMYVKKKIITIEETIDGRQRRKSSDVTETKRIARSKTKYPSYLGYLPIPSEIKHRIDKRSVSKNGKFLQLI